MKKKIMSILLLLVVVITSFGGVKTTVTYADTSSNKVPVIYKILELEPDFFDGFKQPPYNDQCTLYSNVILFKVAAYLNGFESWRNYSIAGCEYAWWTSGGCLWHLESRGMVADTFASDSMIGSDGRYYPNLRGKTAVEKKEAIVKLLDEHPEGIVLYAYQNTSPHAVYLSHVNADGALMVFDPASPGTGIIKLTDSVLADINHCGYNYGRKCESDLEVLECSDQYWTIHTGINYDGWILSEETASDETADLVSTDDIHLEYNDHGRYSTKRITQIYNSLDSKGDYASCKKRGKVSDNC